MFAIESPNARTNSGILIVVIIQRLLTMPECAMKYTRITRPIERSNNCASPWRVM